MGKKIVRFLLIMFILGSIFTAIGYLSTGHNRAQAPVPEKNPAITKDDQSERHLARARISREGIVETKSVSGAEVNVTAVFQQFLSFRKNPSDEAVDILLGYLDCENGVIVSEAIDTLGVIGLNGDQNDLIFSVLKEKAMDKKFSQRGQALLTAAIIGKDQMLPVVSEYISESGDKDGRTGVNKYLVSKALLIINSPECVPYLDSLLKGTDDHKIRKNCYDTLARIDTPESLFLLQEYGLSSHGKNQMASAMALSKANKPAFNQLLAQAIEDKAIEKETIRALAASKAAPDIFGQLLNKESLGEETKIVLLKDIAEYSINGTSGVRSRVSSAIYPLLENSSQAIKIEVIKVIGSLGGEDAGEMLRMELKSDDPEIRKEALMAFVGYANPGNYSDLFELLWDNDENTRRTAMFMVERFVTDEDLQVLKKAALHEDEFIRKRAGELLEKL